MDLFEQLAEQPSNRLPSQGEVLYYGVIYRQAESDALFQQLLTEIDWVHDMAEINGEIIRTPRKVAWYGDRPYEYVYSGVKKTAQPWVACLQTLKEKIEQISGDTYNSCLLNLYQDGMQGMAWHSDRETQLKKEGAIAVLSFGAGRTLQFKQIEGGARVDVQLESGSLLMMKGMTQQYWLHQLPKSKKITQARLSLTFRTID